jgi:hypothetical protein
MVSRGQGSMEYLMTYGWGILVVMIVGVAIWRLGLFNIGGSAAPTAIGFDVLKPILPVCMIKNSVWNPTLYDGLQCQFTNAAGTNIKLKFLDLRINDKTCQWMLTNLDPTWIVGSSATIYRGCADDQGTCDAIPTCNDITSGVSVNCGPAGTGNWMPVTSGKMFHVFMFTQKGMVQGPCSPVRAGTPFSITVDLTYETTSMGAPVTKHSAGTIHLMGT